MAENLRAKNTLVTSYWTSSSIQHVPRRVWLRKWHFKRSEGPRQFM